MSNKLLIFVCFLAISIPFLSSAEEKTVVSPSESTHVSAYEKAKFERNIDAFNSKENTEKRVEKLAEQEATYAKKKTEAAQDKGEGPFKIRF